MDLTLKAALERVVELESLTEDQAIVIDLLQEECAEVRAHNKVLRGQVRDLMMDRTYQVA